MKSLYEKSQEWVGKFEDLKDKIEEELMKTSYKDDIKNFNVVYASGKNINGLKDIGYKQYDKWIYAGIDFDDETIYKCWQKVSDYDCVTVYKLMYIEKNND